MTRGLCDENRFEIARQRNGRSMAKTSNTEPPDRYARIFHKRDKAGVQIMPRVIGREPRRGDAHPLSADDVRNVLRAVPPSYVYGVKSVELRARRHAIGERFGLYRPDERCIHLYSCPPSIWMIGGAKPGTGSGLRRWGAIVTSDAMVPTRLVINWPDPWALWNFYLDTLLHELGHHRAYQYAASRPRPATRWRNEDRADLHSHKIHRYLRKLLAGRVKA